MATIRLAAQGIANGMAVAGFKRLGDELGKGWSGGCVFFDQPLRHFETTQMYWHRFSAILIWPLP